jgi:hypothetical protein
MMNWSIKIKLSGHVVINDSLTTSTNVNENLAGGGLVFYLIAHILIKRVTDYHTLQEMKAF